jgi:hypothetical protein
MKVLLHDIGKMFNGEKLTMEDYIEVEDAYVEAIKVMV